MKRGEWLLFVVSAVFAVSAIGVFPLSWRLATTPAGTDVLLSLQVIYLPVLAAAIGGFPLLVVGLFFQRTRRRALLLLVLSAVFIPCGITGVIRGQEARKQGMESFTVRSQPLIAAIQSYERDHSKPPPSLEALVPTYLPRVPTSGMPAYPNYEYHTGAEAEQEYAGNPWALTVNTPIGLLNWDMFFYFPKQNYPKLRYGSSIERVGDWGYHHE